MKVVVTGGTGFIGRVLIHRLIEAGHTVTVLTRNPGSTRHVLDPAAGLDRWDGRTVGSWVSHVDGADAVINLAGESLGGKRWTSHQKARIVGSRVDATRAIVEAMRRAEKTPSLLLNASAVGYYGHVESGEVLEDHPHGKGFLAETCAMWEQEASGAESLGARVVVTRTGVVLGEDGEALKRMVMPFRLYFGGTIGSGRQWFPWVHREDVVQAMLYLIGRDDVAGPVNVVAPESVTMKEFCAALGRALNRPSWAPAPSFALRLLLGEMSGMILTGQNVVPAKLLRNGFVFRFPSLNNTLYDVLK